MQIAIVDFLEKYKETLFPVVRALHEHGATAYLVGGCVRDMVLNLPLKDLDIEVHGIELPDLQNILARFGHVEEVGKKFGVLLLLGVAIDWSLPRTDSSGRKPQVTLQPQLDIKQALQRRDLTMNAMAIDLTEVICTNVSTISTKDIIDPYGGLRDIAAKQLRAVDDAFFIQDPLRMLRVMQFIGRFAMLPVAELDELCANMPLYDVYDDRPLARERIQAEVVKLLLQAFKPSLGFSWLIKIGRAYELFPFLENNKQTLTVVDRLAQSVRDCSTDEQMILFLTALCFNSIAEIHATFDKQVLKNCTDSQKILKAVEILIQILPRLKTLSNVIACKKIATQL
ncbi:CCA tRNA nucleotidyltransferase, partial [Candidatus Dependentiae bacterium]|nr:CCA tRNA nucleotidyltransferase [Candidatus Dependentiae bacterium]